MTEYDFTLRLDRTGHLTEDQIDAITEATDGDASIEDGPRGVLISFDREAPSLPAAIISAVRDVETVPGMRVAGVTEEDGVTLADIAKRAGRSYEAVRMYAAGKRGPGGFPAPDWTSPGGERFYSWTLVGAWLRDAIGVDVDVPPFELRLADEVLRARKDLEAADEDTRAQFGRLLVDALQAGTGGDARHGSAGAGLLLLRRGGLRQRQALRRFRAQPQLLRVRAQDGPVLAGVAVEQARGRGLERARLG